MNNLRSISILGILVLYPVIAYATRNYLNMAVDYVFGFVGFILLGMLLLEKWMTRTSIRVPYYWMALFCFSIYVMLSGIFVSDVFIEKGVVKYLYSDPFIVSCVLLLVIENTSFSKRLIHFCLPVLACFLFLAAAVSIIQISDPLFLLDQSLIVGNGMDAERLKHYFELHPEELDMSTVRMMEGYRFSIYSWINQLSVGMDSLAIFSILFGLSFINNSKKIAIWSATGLISFLSNARWIMLNFVLISLQQILVGKHKLYNSIKTIGIFAGMLVVLVFSSELLGLDLKNFVENRLLSDSAGTRFYAFEVFSKVFPLNPIFGTGGVNTPEMLMLLNGKTSQIHVGWLKLLYYYGYVGALLFGSFLVLLLVQLWTRAKKTQYWGSFFAFLAFIMANFTLVEFDIMYHGLLLAIIFSFSIYNKEDKNKKHKPKRVEKKEQISQELPYARSA